MLARDWQMHVADIAEAVEKIRRYTEQMDFEAFAVDDKTVDAVIRNLITIGEAAGNVPEDLKTSHPSIPWRLMRDMRNFAVHRYWGVNSEIIWETIRTDLPPLLVQLRAILDESSTADPV